MKSFDKLDTSLMSGPDDILNEVTVSDENVPLTSVGNNDDGIPMVKVTRRCCSRRCRCVCMVLVLVVIIILLLFAGAFVFWPLFPPFNKCGNYNATFNAGPMYKFNYASYTNDTLRINEIQWLTTHNSYHMPGLLAPFVYQWRYQLPPITDQLQLGVQGFEFDVHYSRLTGKFYNFHVAVVDSYSRCWCLLDCFAPILEWHKNNPSHLPIFFQIEPKVR